MFHGRSPPRPSAVISASSYLSLCSGLQFSRSRAYLQQGCVVSLVSAMLSCCCWMVEMCGCGCAAREAGESLSSRAARQCGTVRPRRRLTPCRAAAAVGPAGRARCSRQDSQRWPGSGTAAVRSAIVHGEMDCPCPCEL